MGLRSPHPAGSESLSSLRQMPTANRAETARHSTRTACRLPPTSRRSRDAYEAIAPDPAHFDEFAAKNTAMVHEFPGWTGELRSLDVPTMLIFGDRAFSPLRDVAKRFELLPNARLAVLPGTTHLDVPRRAREVHALITAFLAAR